jgi:hypothetical protein
MLKEFSIAARYSDFTGMMYMGMRLSFFAPCPLKGVLKVPFWDLGPGPRV